MRRTVLAFALAACCGGAGAAEVTLTASADASIYGGAAGYDQIADGAGPYVWVATTAADVSRRALLRFDLAAIPVGAQVQQVELSLYLSRAQDLDPEVSVHRLLAAWTEGPANGGSQGHGAPASAGDATWLRRSYPSLAWAQPGGDFDAQASATKSLGLSGEYQTWGPTPRLLADVQGWLAAPASNHGWIVIGNEVNSQNAKRFESRAGPSSVRPKLRVVYAPPAVADADIPIPGWALGALAAVLVTTLARRRRASPAVRTDAPGADDDTRMT